MVFKRITVIGIILVFLSSFVFAGPTVSSSTHPDFDSWYRSNSPSFEIETQGTGYSYAMNFDPDTIPPEEVMTNNSTVSFTNRTDGVQYFHARVKSGGNWSDTTHFKIQIDRTKPLPPQKPKAVLIDSDSIELTWEPGIDIHSGIDGYKIFRSFLKDFEIQFDPHTVVAEKVTGLNYIDTDISSGFNHHYRLQAIDNVGNLGGITKSFTAIVPPVCDFDTVIETSLEGDTLSITIDSSPHIMFFTKLILKPANAEEIVVFVNRSNEDLIQEEIDLSELSDQEILIDFDAKDRNNDICDAEKTFFLDRIEPDGTWVFPQENDTIGETVLLKFNAFDQGTSPSGVEKVEFFYEDEELIKIGDAEKSETDEYVFEWDSSSTPNGRFNLIAKIFDQAGNLSQKEIIVTFYNTAIISAEVEAAIEQALQKKEEAIEIENQIKLLGIEAVKFFEIFESADSNLLRAQQLFEGGVNFERAKKDAENSLDLFINAISLASIEKTDTINYVFVDPQTGFGKVGLLESLRVEASQSIEQYAPVRRLDIFKIVDGNETYYMQVYHLTITGVDFSNYNVQIVEPIPKSLATSASEIHSSYEFSVLNSDPVIKFDLDLNESKRVSYSLGEKLSRNEINELIQKNPLKDFKSLPIILSSQTPVDTLTVIEPLDFFKIIEPLTSEYDNFTLFIFGIGAFAIIFVVLAIISIFVVLIAVLKSR